MRFSIFTTILAAACAIAAPAPEARDLGVSISIGDALGLVKNLTATLQVHVGTINGIVATIKPTTSKADKDLATAKINTEFSAMTIEVSKTIGNVALKANKVNITARGLPAVLADLVKAIQDLVTLVVNVVKAVLAVVDLAAILKTVVALLGAITGLIQTLLKTVSGLLAALQPLLSSLLNSIDGILKAILV